MKINSINIRKEANLINKSENKKRTINSTANYSDSNELSLKHLLSDFSLHSDYAEIKTEFSDNYLFLNFLNIKKSSSKIPDQMSFKISISKLNNLRLNKKTKEDINSFVSGLIKKVSEVANNRKLKLNKIFLSDEDLAEILSVRDKKGKPILFELLNLIIQMAKEKDKSKKVNTKKINIISKRKSINEIVY